MTARTSPLDAVHRAAGARMVDFAGWDMPLSYPPGTVAEHLACRRECAVFDVSHLGTVRVLGPEGLGALQRAFTNDLRRIAPGRAQYTHLLDADDGSVLDDVIVWWVEAERFDVMPNASNTARVTGAVPGVDVTAERAVIAVQGPAARRVVGRVAPGAAEVARFHVAAFEWSGERCLAAGTGYTGEDGVECAVPAALAPGFWDAVVGAGAVPAGLGARDTLRLEAGLPLHGHELGPGITPLQAGLSWVVGWDKGDFRGRAALEGERERGLQRILRGLVCDGRQPPRAGYPVTHAGKPVGAVTSGNFSPCLEQGIALAFLPPDVVVGDAVEVEMRGRGVAARVVKTPFVGGRT
jgi:aminomethyltransferase